MVPNEGETWVRILIKTICIEGESVPFNYQLQLNNSIRFALVTGINKLEKSDNINPEHIIQMKKIIIENKQYTYSKFNFFPKNINSDGFFAIKRAEIIFCAPLPDNYFTYFVDIFEDFKFRFSFNKNEIIFISTHFVKIYNPEFTQKMYFITKSPIAVYSTWNTKYNTIKKHFYNYTKNKERVKYISKLKESLIEKYEEIYEKLYTGSFHLYFKFDTKYMHNNKGKISKLIHFENDVKIKAFEAPFVLEADPDLIKIGYECGLGHESDRGFGCIEINEKINFEVE